MHGLVRVGTGELRTALGLDWVTRATRFERQETRGDYQFCTRKMPCPLSMNPLPPKEGGHSPPLQEGSTLDLGTSQGQKSCRAIGTLFLNTDGQQHCRRPQDNIKQTECWPSSQLRCWGAETCIENEFHHKGHMAAIIRSSGFPRPGMHEQLVKPRLWISRNKLVRVSRNFMFSVRSNI